MSGTSIPTGLLDSIIAIIAGVLFTLVGIIYRRLQGRIETLEDTIGNLESRIIEIKRDMEIAHSWMFGREEDPTNSGIAAEIDDIQDLQEQLVDALHDEDELDFDRDDLDE